MTWIYVFIGYINIQMKNLIYRMLLYLVIVTFQMFWFLATTNCVCLLDMMIFSVISRMLCLLVTKNGRGVWPHNKFYQFKMKESCHYNCDLEQQLLQLLLPRSWCTVLISLESLLYTTQQLCMCPCVGKVCELCSVVKCPLWMRAGRILFVLFLNNIF